MHEPLRQTPHTLAEINDTIKMLNHSADVWEIYWTDYHGTHNLIHPLTTSPT